MRKARGLYTDEHVARCSQLGGQFSKDLEKMFSENVGSDRLDFIRDGNVDNSDVKVFLENYGDDELWAFKPGRFHTGFKNIKHEWRIKNCAKFIGKLTSLGETLDMWRSFVN